MSMPVDPQPVHPRALDYSESLFYRMIPDESELSAGTRIIPGKIYGFFTDTSLCIGCKACEVACKEWNHLSSGQFKLSGMSYDNTRSLSASVWRHVLFIEKIEDINGESSISSQPFQSQWLMMSDVCKHCRRAGCLEACPTGALFRTEFGSVVVQQDICNGCGYCVPSCPFGVIELNLQDGKAHKCTLSYDRDLRQWGRSSAYLYGVPGAPGATGGVGELHAFFLLLDRPEVYNLPVAPKLPAVRINLSLALGIATMGTLALATKLLFARKR